MLALLEVGVGQMLFFLLLGRYKREFECSNTWQASAE